VSLLVPSLESVSLVDGVTVKDGFIYLSEDEIIPQQSIQGIATAEMLLAIANGEDAEAASQRISSEIESMFGSTAAGEAVRGVYLNSVPLWTDATVTYKWGDIRSSFKTATRNAMTRWETATGREVKFKEFSESGWDWFLVVIGALHMVRIEERTLSDASGKALPGSWPWGISYLYLDPNECSLDGSPSTYPVYSVALHELGHVLGLQHEHERADRDTYLDISGFRLSEWLTLVSTRLVWRSVRVLFITIYYPVFETYTEFFSSCVKTAWDWGSIMLYENLRIQPKHVNTTNGKPDNPNVTKYNTDLSTKDIEIIKTLY
jgi:hypothetical protein